MQRKLLALAVAGAFAVPGAAIAQVTISGQFRYSLDNVRWNSGTGATLAGSGVSKWGITSNSGNIKFTSRENVGGGMTAWGVLEAGLVDGRLNAQNNQWNGRNSGIGIDSTSWGTVMIGIWDTPYKQMDGVWSIGSPAAYTYGPTAPIFGRGDTTGTHPNPNCAVTESGAGWTITTGGQTANVATVCAGSAGSPTSFQRRLNNTFQYWSPVWNGVQILVATQGNEQKASSTIGVGGTINRADPTLWSYALRWTGPRWGLIVAHERHKNYNLNALTTASTTATTNRSSRDTGTKIGGNYNFGPIQLSLAHERLNYEVGTIAAPTNHRERNTSLGLAWPVGNGVIRSQASRGRVSGNNAATTSAANGRLFNLSYEHNLSKRTIVFIAYAKLGQDSGSNRQFGANLDGPNGWQAANLIGTDPRYLSFGMNHNF